VTGHLPRLGCPQATALAPWSLGTVVPRPRALSAVAAHLAALPAGPASRAVGAAASGAGIFTGPRGVTDLVTRADGGGNLHAVYQSGRDLWYVKFDAALACGRPEKLASGAANPDLLVDESGAVSVVAFDPPRGKFVMLRPGPEGEAAAGDLDLRADGKRKVTDPFAYRAAAGGTHFLFFIGEYEGKPGGLLFARAPGGEGFVYRDWVPARGGTQAARPSFTGLPDGRAVLLYTDAGGYAEVAWVAKGG
jgi:hypothetical protein